MKGSWILSQHDKAEIARLYRAQRVPLREIAAQYRVSIPAVFYIARRRNAPPRQGERS